VGNQYLLENFKTHDFKARAMKCFLKIKCVAVEL